MLVKPSVLGKPSFVVSVSGTAIAAPVEVSGFHYFNSTAGVGRVDIYDGTTAPGNIRCTMGSDAANGTDDIAPNRPFKFIRYLNVQFTTGTGVVTIFAE